MAARRVAKSAVDWAAFAERTPAHYKDHFRALKAKSDMFISRVHRYPESLAPIDFSQYATKLQGATYVTEFEKAYKALQVPYPKDKDNVRAKIDEQEKEAQQRTKKEIEETRHEIEKFKAILKMIDDVPDPDKMTAEMYFDYVPSEARNPWEKPTFWPHTRSYQPENDPDTCK